MERTQKNIQGVSVAVIGGAGFLGSHLVEHLIVDRKCDVLVLDNLITGQKRFVHPEAKFVWCDITQSEERMKNLFIEHKVQYVFNYAAEPYIPVSFQRPLHVFDTNARAALMVMNAAQEAGVEAILQVSSAEIYGDGREAPITEKVEVHPHSTYGAAKAAVDYLVQCRWREAGTPAIALRQFNCVGERETHPYIIPEIIKQISESGFTTGKSVVRTTVRLGNDSTRDFQYAGDAVRMAVELLEKGEFGEVYNMGSQDSISMYELAEKIGTLMGYEVEVIKDEARVRPWEIWHLQSDNSKLYGVIKYRPQFTLEHALLRTIAWFKGNGNVWDF